MTAAPPVQPFAPPSPERFLSAGPACAPDCIEIAVRLRFTRRKPFRFLHGGVLHGLLCQVLGHHLPQGLVVWAPESGRVGFEAGDPYVFSVVLTGAARRRLAEVQPGLQAVAAAPARRGPRKVFDGNFLVESVTSRPLDGGAGSEGGEKRGVCGTDPPADRVTLRFLSPLRLRRPEPLAIAGGAFVDAGCFPAGSFLQRLYQRWHLLTFGVHPDAKTLPEPPAALAASPGRLLWVDLPIRGKQDPPEGGRARPPKTLGGVLGDVTFSGLTSPWLRLLEIMQPLHAGASSRFGFGRYVLDQRPGTMPTAPGRRHIDDVATCRSLAAAVEREARTGGAGSDGVKPESFVKDGARQLDSIADQLRSGTYRPDPLLHFDGHAVPTVRDRVVQRALVEQLRPSIEELRRNCAGRDANPSFPADADDLAALFPMEPAIELLRAFSRAPVQTGGNLRDQGADLRVVSPLRELCCRS